MNTRISLSISGSKGLEWLELVVEVGVLHLNVEAADLDPVVHLDLVAAFLGDDVHCLSQTTPDNDNNLQVFYTGQALLSLDQNPLMDSMACVK